MDQLKMVEMAAAAAAEKVAVVVGVKMNLVSFKYVMMVVVQAAVAAVQVVKVELVAKVDLEVEELSEFIDLTQILVH